MKTVYDRIWFEHSFIQKALLFFQSQYNVIKILFNYDQERFAQELIIAAGVMEHVYTSGWYHIIDIRRHGRVDFYTLYKFILWCVTWFPFMVVTFDSSLFIAEYAMKKLGYKATGKQLEIYQRCLRNHDRFEEALKVIGYARTRMATKMYTRSLLHVGEGEIFQKAGRRSEAIQALCEAENHACITEIKDRLESARIFLYCAIIYQRMAEIDKAESLFKDAHKHALESNAGDLLYKIQATRI